VLRRVVFISRTIAATGLSTVSLAHIIGAANRNNARASITAGLVMQGDRVVEAMEGPAHEIGRALDRVRTDPRHTDVEVIVDTPISCRVMSEPMEVCHDPSAFLRAMGVSCLSAVTAEAADAYVERKLAA
jgi:hypothetical protein